jgi:hypothetical protein
MAFAISSAQSQTPIPAACEKASPQIQELIISVIDGFDANEPAKSIIALEKMLVIDRAEKLKGLCRAWVYQWLALCYDDLDSLEMARKYVILSLEEDPEIWREHADSRLKARLRKTYQDCWEEILERFMKKRKSWRVAVGPIIRADISNRYGMVTGIATTFVSINLDSLEVFKDLLLFVRLQRMRKNIERLTSGFYGEFSLSLRKAEKPAKVLSFGPILSYAYQSGSEIGCTFEIARLVIGSGKTRISQTIFFKENKSLAFSYANFEIYLRKWF